MVFQSYYKYENLRERKSYSFIFYFSQVGIRVSRSHPARLYQLLGPVHLKERDPTVVVVHPNILSSPRSFKTCNTLCKRAQNVFSNNTQNHWLL